MTANRHELEATYRGYEDADEGRWATGNPGNRAIHLERNRGFEAAIDRCAPIGTLLELGCGDGRLLEELAALPRLATTTLVGVDVLGFRLVQGRHRGNRLPLVQADGRALPLPDRSVDVVVVSTVFSSIPAGPLAEAVAADVDRVLRAGGTVLWYDMRLPNPANRNVHALPRRRVLELFPGYAADLRSTTLVPQLARRLGGRTDAAYPVLVRLPLLRSHLLGTLRKPG